MDLYTTQKLGKCSLADWASRGYSMPVPRRISDFRASGALKSLRRLPVYPQTISPHITLSQPLYKHRRGMTFHVYKCPFDSPLFQVSRPLPETTNVPEHVRRSSYSQQTWQSKI